MDAPWAFSAFFSAISPFIDPVTREKIQFVKGSTAEKRALLVQHIDPAVLQVRRPAPAAHIDPAGIL